MGVSEYRLAQALPEAIGRELPPIEKLDHELGNRFVIGKSAINGPDKIN
jgi:hypothetical protein